MANPRRYAQGPAFPVVARVPNADGARSPQDARYNDTTAYDWFKRLRWRETEGEPYGP